MKPTRGHNEPSGGQQPGPFKHMLDGNHFSQSFQTDETSQTRMPKLDLQHRETVLLEILLSSLDARESAKQSRSTMLVYLSDLLVTRAKEELERVRVAIERLAEDPANRDQPT